MNAHYTAHPDPASESIRTTRLHESVTIKLGDDLTIILSERDPAVTEAWLLDAAFKLESLARSVAVRAAIKATA